MNVRKLLAPVVLLGFSFSLLAGPVRLNYVAGSAPEADGADVDEQLRWQGAVDKKIHDDPAAALTFFGVPDFGLPLELWGAYGVSGVGESESGDTLEHEQEVYLKLPGNRFELDLGVSRETSGEGGEHESIRQIFARVNLHQPGLVLSLTGASVVDASDDVTRDVRTWGDAKEWGLSAAGQLSLGGKAVLLGEAGPDWLLVGVSPSGEGVKPMVFVADGKNVSLASLGEFERSVNFAFTNISPF